MDATEVTLQLTDWLPGAFGLGGTLLGAIVGAGASIWATSQQLKGQEKQAQRDAGEQRRRDSTEAARAVLGIYASLSHEMGVAEREFWGHEADVGKAKASLRFSEERRRALTENAALIVSRPTRMTLADVQETFSMYLVTASMGSSKPNFRQAKSVAQYGHEVVAAYLRGDDDVPDETEAYIEAQETIRSYWRSIKVTVYDGDGNLLSAESAEGDV